ncbi:response regulator transcription factor [Actinotalea sp. K2]|uniref:helix-turn-helix transcriptional regulator n=1 Tax=Actinotalea sp. K2 TaxID=2939438 RepID=UPI002016DDE2|nr:response regulator transcription factor [Actinotalea sp. K2]MCL3860430.1 response regulator transcription factor [Actinotalea sp. K2]
MTDELTTPRPTMDRPQGHGGVVAVRIDASDPLTAVGTTEALRWCHDLHATTAADNGSVADVVVVLADTVDESTLTRIRAAHAVEGRPVVLVVSVLDDDGVLRAVEAGVRGVLRRHEASPERLAELVRSTVRGEGAMPSDVLGHLLDQVGRIHAEVLAPLGLHLNGLSERETQVLRLVADGLETAEIAQRLNYSQRTIKGVMHDVTMRLHLRNRAHAVAYAVRQGLI